MSGFEIQAMTTAMMAIDLAAAHVGEGRMVDSAELALSDARYTLARGLYRNAAERAAASLSYSVGVFHPDHVRAVELVAEVQS